VIAVNLLSYFGPPILFILLCMGAARWLGAKQGTLNWMVRSAGRWLTTWSAIGFAMAMLLGTLAWAMNTDDVMNDASLVWPFCIGLMALDGNPSALAIIIVLSITAIQNSVLYLILAALVWGSSNWIPKIWRAREEPPSIFGH